MKYRYPTNDGGDGTDSCTFRGSQRTRLPQPGLLILAEFPTVDPPMFKKERAVPVVYRLYSRVTLPKDLSFDFLNRPVLRQRWVVNHDGFSNRKLHERFSEKIKYVTLIGRSYRHI